MWQRLSILREAIEKGLCDISRANTAWIMNAKLNDSIYNWASEDQREFLTRLKKVAFCGRVENKTSCATENNQILLKPR
jgi:hypothetical protein